MLASRVGTPPRDEAAEAKIELLSDYVRAHYREQHSCPSAENLEDYSTTRTGSGLCPGGGVPDYPCVGYYPLKEINDCMFRHPSGLDDHWMYLARQRRWYDTDEWIEMLRSKSPAASLMSAR